MLGQELNRDQSQLAQNAKSACENDVKRRPCLVKNIHLYLMAKGHNSGLLFHCLNNGTYRVCVNS